jgi:GntR family transcriptional regulator of arabinose operon
MQIFKVSRTTVRKALLILKDNGLINRSSGSGTFYTGRQYKQASVKGTKTIGLVNYFFMDYIFTEILRGIEDEINKSGYSLVISNNTRDDDDQNRAIKQLIEQGIAGLILEPNYNLQKDDNHPILSCLKDSGIPVVTTHRQINHKSGSTVTVDDIYAGELAAQYLLDKGHTRMGYIYKYDVQPVFDRYKGFWRRLAMAGFPLEDKYCCSYISDDKAENLLQGYILTKKMILENKIPPTAIFYFNDNLAIQGYKALAELSLRVPEDVSVIGFDDHSNAAIVSPPLTTFSHPKYDLGKWAARILIDKIENRETAKPMKFVFEPKLIERGSVASV